MENPLVPEKPELSGEELEAVFRRAAELQFRRAEVADPSTDRVSAAEVIRIGEEAGLEAPLVRQALAELKANTLVPPRPKDTRLGVRAWGNAFVHTSRVVAGDPPEALARLSEYFGAQAGLRRVRDRHDRQVWEPAKDFWSQLKRGFQAGSPGYELTRARRVEVVVEPLESGRSLMTITADLTNVRRGHAGGWYAGAALALLPVSIGLLEGVGVPAALGLPLVAGAGGMIGTLGVRRTFGRRCARVDLAIQGLLDGLEQGRSLLDEKTGLRRRLGALFEED